MAMLRLLGLIVGLTAVCQVRSECKPVFKEDAASLVSASFASVFRRGAKTYDYKYIEVIYSPFQMVEDRSCVDEAQLNLEVKMGSGEWVAVDSTPATAPDCASGSATLHSGHVPRHVRGSADPGRV